MPASYDPIWAWTPYRPDPKRPWDLRGAGHLFRRAGFGANWDQLQQAFRDGPQRTIDRLFRPDDGLAAFNRTYNEYEAGSDSTDGLRAWWLRRMVLSPQPLLEKMTLFWHGHFGVNVAKVGSASLMRQHVQLLRSHALGRFDLLLQAVVRDPALLVSHEGNVNRKARPSEHFARCLLDRFAMGTGRSSPKDVTETARAFTGWFVLQDQFRVIAHEHDDGVKRIFGQEGRWKGEDVPPLLLKQPATARFLVRKLYRWLVSETDEPGDELLAPLADAFAKDWDVLRLLETVLRSNWFFSPAAYRQRVKSPIEFALGIIAGMGELVPTLPLGQDLAGLGQNLGHPPSVRGWQGGRAWINAATVLMRSNLAAALLAGAGRYGEKINPLTVAKKHGQTTPEAIRRFLLDLFLQGDVGEKVVAALDAADSDAAAPTRQLAHCVVTLPEFQLA